MRILNHERIIVSDTGINAIPPEKGKTPTGGHICSCPIGSHRAGTHKSIGIGIDVSVDGRRCRRCRQSRERRIAVPLPSCLYRSVTRIGRGMTITHPIGIGMDVSVDGIP